MSITFFLNSTNAFTSFDVATKKDRRDLQWQRQYVVSTNMATLLCSSLEDKQ
jgi:hypothetical protein